MSGALRSYVSDLNALKALIAADPDGPRAGLASESVLTTAGRSPPPATFAEEKKALLGHILEKARNSGQGDVRAAESQHQVLPIVSRSAAGTAAVAEERYAAILKEVEELSATVTSLQLERAHIEDGWSARLQTLRGEIEDRDALIAALEDREAQLRREIRRRHHEPVIDPAAFEELRKRVDFLHAEGAEREALIASQDAAVRQLEVKLEAASGAALEWEKRLRAATADAEKTVKFVMERIAAVANVASTLRKLSSSTVEQFASGGGHFARGLAAAAAPLDKCLDRMVIEGATNEETQCEVHLRNFVTAVESAVQAISREAQDSVASREELETELWRSRERAAHAEAQLAELRGALAAADAAAGAASVENSTLIERIISRDAIHEETVERLRESEDRVAHLEAANEAAASDHHRARLQLNELSAQVTRLTSQKQLSEENAATLSAELRGAEQRREQAVARLRETIDELREERAKDRGEIRRLQEQLVAAQTQPQARTREVGSSSGTEERAPSEVVMTIVEESDADGGGGNGASLKHPSSIESTSLVSALRRQRDMAAQRLQMHSSFIQDAASSHDSRARALEAENRALGATIAQLRTELKFSAARQEQLLREKRLMEALKLSAMQ